MHTQKNNQGFTLVELLITVGLFTIIIGIAVGGFTSAIRTQRQVASLISAQSNVSLALEQMAREIRTGYLFCNTVGNTNAGTTNANANPNCHCTLSATESTAWQCSVLDFYDAEGDHVEYKQSSPAGSLEKSTDGGVTFQSVTGDGVSLKYLNFLLFGQVEGDNWTPRVTVSLGITPSSSDPAVQSDVFNLETTVSARTIDCTESNGIIPPQC